MESNSAMQMVQAGHVGGGDRADHRRLARQVGVTGAVMIGLGSMIGTGIFVSIGIASAVAGPSVILAIVVAALVAACNALSSAQLAANHAVSGGTYEYGYRWLHPALGFTAGWMFLSAKTASAATAALGFSGYVLALLGHGASGWHVLLAVAIVAVTTLLVLSGIRRSNATNIVIVSITLGSLGFLLLAAIPAATAGAENLTPFFRPVVAGRAPLPGFLEACALMFVAYTGYGRIATLGGEIHDPRKNIPRAIIVTVLVSMALYSAIGLIAIMAIGAGALAGAAEVQAAPLQIVAHRSGIPAASVLLTLGAITAMLGVLLNLILGLSRVVFAMGRRGDAPPVVSRVSTGETTPYAAVLVVGISIAALALIGNVRTTWSFSAFTVLIYYALTNLCAIRLNPAERLYPRFIPWAGLIACLSLAFWVEPAVWATGLGLIAAGLVWHWAARRSSSTRNEV